MEKTVEQIEEERIEAERVEAERVKAEKERDIKSEVDRRLTGAMQKKEAEYKEKLAEKDRQSKLSAEELKKERDKEHADWEAKTAKYELEQNKHELFKKEGYDPKLEKYVFGNTIDEISASAKKLTEIISKLVTLGVTEKLQSGHKPPMGGSGNTNINPWAKDTFNLTQQGKMLQDNPTLAATLMAANK